MELDMRELGIIKRMAQAGLLRPVDPRRLVSKGAMLVFCGDCDESPELLQYLRRLTKKRFPRFHHHGWNGGPLRLHKAFPGNFPGGGDHAFCLRELKFTALKKKGIKSAKLVIHFPCGMVRESKITAERAFELLYEIKSLIKKTLEPLTPGIKVALFCLFKYDKRKKRVYYFCDQDFPAWLAMNAS